MGLGLANYGHRDSVGQLPAAATKLPPTTPSIHISVGGRQKYPLITVSLCGTLYYHFPGILFKFVQLVRREQPRVLGTGRLDLAPEEHVRSGGRDRG